MKRVLFVVTAMALLVNGMAYVEAETPVIDQRQTNQEQRIDQSVASGQLNKRAANRPNKQQKHINKVEGRAKSDGVVTEKDRARISEAQNRSRANFDSIQLNKQDKPNRLGGPDSLVGRLLQCAP